MFSFSFLSRGVSSLCLALRDLRWNKANLQNVFFSFSALLFYRPHLQPNFLILSRKIFARDRDRELIATRDRDRELIAARDRGRQLIGQIGDLARKSENRVCQIHCEENVFKTPTEQTSATEIVCESKILAQN